MEGLWSKDIRQWCSHNITEKIYVANPFDLTSNDNDQSPSYRPESVVSENTTKSHQQLQTNLSVLSQSENEHLPSSQFEGQIVELEATSGYPIKRVNGQRILGPPLGWTKPRPESTCEIFVRSIPRNIYEDTLYPVFSTVGEIYKIRLMLDVSGTNRGYCFVMFTKVEYAERAIRELNNWEFQPGRKIGVVSSCNNCGLFLGLLPPHINPEIVMKTFYDLTEGVRKVSVYKYRNGIVRYALIWYQTHRGAALAKKKLVPDRATLFGTNEVGLYWARFDLKPDNMIEETGTRDENGALQISCRLIPRNPNRSVFQRRGEEDVPDKSIKNYLPEKDMEDERKNSSIQRKSCGSNSTPNDFEAQENLGNVDYLNANELKNQKCQEIGNDEKYGPLKIVAPNANHENSDQIVAAESNGLIGFTNIRALNQITNCNENFRQNQVDPRVIGNVRKNHGNLETKNEKNNCYADNNYHDNWNFYQACKDYLQRVTTPIYRHGTYIFDNYFRAFDTRSFDREKDESQQFLFPIDKITPQHLYGISSSAGYHLVPVYPDKDSLRAILGRMSMKDDGDC